MPTKKQLQSSLIGYKGNNQHLINLLLSQKLEMRALMRKIEYREKQIAYLVKKAYPKTRNNASEYENLLHKYLFRYHARIPRNHIINTTQMNLKKSVYEHTKKIIAIKQKKKEVKR